MINSLKLVSEDKRELYLQLSKDKRPYTAEEILSVEKKIYGDLIYQIEIEELNENAEIELYINDEYENVYFDGHIITFASSRFNQPSFKNRIGFLQLALCIKDNGAEEWFYSEFCTLLVKATDTTHNIDLMLKYIYENQRELLKESASVTHIGDEYDKTYNDFGSQVSLLEEIANIYEALFGYFKANCRFKLEKHETVDRVEKLQYIDAKTTYYIAQHPELLKQQTRGIKVGKEYYLPNKTLMLQNVLTQDIYENQVVVGFLDRVSIFTSELKKKIDSYLDLIKIENHADEGYIFSSYILFLNAQEMLNSYKSRIDDVMDKFNYLVHAYHSTMKVNPIDCISMPKASPIFWEVPQYNRIYTCIVKWYGCIGYDLRNEQMMLRFINAPMIYEAYVLIKLIKAIQKTGFELLDAYCFEYPKNDSWLFESKDFNNTYIFSRGNEKLTLYYEPIIYDELHAERNNINLYRNNTIPFPQEKAREKRGHYYVPDYLLKYEVNSTEKYIICDAKLTHETTVRVEFIPRLSYKYLFSISGVNQHTVVNGMNIFYGLPYEDSYKESFYDKQIAEPIKPYVELIPLSEKIPQSIQDRDIQSLLNNQLNI